MLSTFSPVEMIWTLLGVVGFLFSLANLRDAVLDSRALDAIIHDGSERVDNLRAIARAAIRQESLRMLKMVIVMTIGLFAGFTRPPIPPNVHIPTWTPVGIVVTAGLISIVVIITVQAALDRRLRKRFYNRAIH